MSSDIVDWMRVKWGCIMKRNGGKGKRSVAQSKRWKEKALADGRTLYKRGKWVRP